jgi:hypothetical protein
MRLKQCHNSFDGYVLSLFHQNPIAFRVAQCYFRLEQRHKSDSSMEPNEDGDVFNATASARIPPYIAFATFLTLLNELKTNSVPPQIDSSVLRRFSGGIQNQLKMAIRSLGLVEGVKPTPQLAALVEAYETPQFEPMLADLLKANYPYVFALDLMTATPTMFAEAFKGTGAKEDVARKCRTFFLHAAKRAGIPIGPRILTGSAPPKGPSNGHSRRRARPRPKEPGTDASQTGGENTGQKTGRSGSHTLQEKLLDKFPEFDPTWPNDIKKLWFEDFDRFMTGAGINKKGDA